MADFSINATQLSAPQGAGATPVDPVQERAINTSPMNIIQGVGEIFAKGLQQNAKEQAAQRENAVLKEYSGKVGKINDALSRGAMKPAEAAARIRAIDNEYAAGYPEYIESLKKSADFFRGKTEIGEAEDQIKMEKRLREKDMTDASNMGYTFYAGMSEDAVNKTIDAYKYARRMEYEFDQSAKRNAELRAQRGDSRAEQSHLISVQQYQDKENAVVALRTLADRNFDAMVALGNDLTQNTSMQPEQKMMLLQSNLSLIKAGLQAVAGSNPQLAEGWGRIFDEMATLQQKMLDPKAKAQGEAETLKAQYDALITKGKIMAVTSDPNLYKVVLTSSLFPNETILTTLSASSTAANWLLNASIGVEGKEVKWLAPLVGSPHEQVTYKGFSDALRKAQASGDTKATAEAANVANVFLRDIAKNGGDVDAKSLKQASAFYASSEFGKLAKEGKLNREQLEGAKTVFQLNYEPAVKQAIMDRLTKPTDSGGTKLLDTVDFRLSGDRIKIESKGTASNVGVNIANRVKDLTNPLGTIANQFQTNRELSKVEEGLNQLIHMGAHLEGHTDYGKYWEANKHLLLPGLYPAPADSGDDKSKQSPGKGGTKQQSTGKITTASSNWWEQ